MKTWLWGGVLCAVVLLGLGAGEPAAPDAYRGRVVELTNVLRQRKNLSPLQGREDLNRIATAYARELAARQVLSHFGPRGEALDRRLNAAGCTDWKQAGENLWRGTYTAAFAVDDVVKGWELSAGHYQNIVTPGFRFIGVGWALDARGEMAYFVQIFIE